MRRLLATLLLIVFVLPMLAASLAFGQDAEAGLPACCRRSGAHHCAMSMGERAQVAAAAPQEHRWGQPAEHCPYCPAAATATHANPLAFTASWALLPGTQSLVAQVWQAQTRRRIARERSRHKRGPPGLLHA